MSDGNLGTVVGVNRGDLVFVHRGGVLGDLDTESHDGESDNDTPIMGYLKQIVTAVANGDFSAATAMEVLGLLTTGAHAGAVSGVNTTIMAFVKQLVTQLLATNAQLLATDTVVDNNALGLQAGQSFIITTGEDLASSEIGLLGLGADGNGEGTLADVAGGLVLVEDIILETDSVGLAGGTEIVISKSTGYGVDEVSRVLVADLGASQHVRCDVVPFLLDDGDSLEMVSTPSACTGAGIMRVTIIGKRVAAASLIAIGTGF